MGFASGISPHGPSGYATGHAPGYTPQIAGYATGVSHMEKIMPGSSWSRHY